MGEKEARILLDKVSKVIVAKGKKSSVYNVKKENPADIAAAMLGPTGNLRAPNIQIGKTLLVGFNDEAYHNQLDLKKVSG